MSASWAASALSVDSGRTALRGLVLAVEGMVRAGMRGVLVAKARRMGMRRCMVAAESSRWMVRVVDGWLVGVD